MLNREQHSTDTQRRSTVAALTEDIQSLVCGHLVDDVARAAASILLVCIIQKTKSKEQAVEFARMVLRALPEEIDRSYERLRVEIEGHHGNENNKNH